LIRQFGGNGKRASPPRLQAGVNLAAAIFVITLLALIAVAINALVSQNAQTYQEEINLTRAFYAAESGAGFGMNTIFPPEGFPTYGAPAECAAGPRVYTFTVPGLGGCSASVTCATKSPAGISDTFATVTSVGSCDGVERTVQVQTRF
jgi:MSHA biogenesis protein MshP